MSLSSFCVVTNALRLNFCRIYKAEKNSRSTADASIQSSSVPSETILKTVRIEGMMCGHCEKSVKEALEAFPQVINAEVSHTSGTAVLKLSAELSDRKIKKAVAKAGYKVL